jgi:hypothetical protein
VPTWRHFYNADLKVLYFIQFGTLEKEPSDWLLLYSKLAAVDTVSLLVPYLLIDN